MPALDDKISSPLSALSPRLLNAIVDAPIPAIGDGPHDSNLAAVLAGNGVEDWNSVPAPARSLCQSGLWLLAGELDRSHQISQNIESAEGSFWHGIMHRREGDFDNAKYWFRRVGHHTIFERLNEITDGVYADPFDFVDACQAAIKEGGVPESECQQAQWIEWQALMAHCLS